MVCDIYQNLWSFFLPNLVSNAHIPKQHKKFIAKFVSHISHVYFNVMSGICCTNLSICGWSFAIKDWPKLFIQIIHSRAQFVQLVIIRALRIELFVLLKCRQIWIFANIFLRQFPSSELCPTHHSRDHNHWREESKN